MEIPDAGRGSAAHCFSLFLCVFLHPKQSFRKH